MTYVLKLYKWMTIGNGTTLNQYKILSPIGKGGMGEVFLALDTRLDRKVALKILPSEFADDKDRMARFVLEAKSVSALNHPTSLRFTKSANRTALISSSLSLSMV